MQLCPLAASTMMKPTPVGVSASAHYVGDINAFVAIEAESHFAERVRSNFGYEADAGSEPGAGHCLIGTFSAVVHAIACSQQGFAGAWHTLDFHGQTGGIAAHNGDAWAGSSRNRQEKSPRQEFGQCETGKRTTTKNRSG